VLAAVCLGLHAPVLVEATAAGVGYGVFHLALARWLHPAELVVLRSMVRRA
jgi:hypothetical protein